MTRWSGSSKGKITFENGEFALNFDVMDSVNDIRYEWTKEVCELRLHLYFEKKTVDT